MEKAADKKDIFAPALSDSEARAELESIFAHIVSDQLEYQRKLKEHLDRGLAANVLFVFCFFFFFFFFVCFPVVCLAGGSG